ncbi:MAG: hypothetical protein KDD68_19755, partial [Bdellovibrionales bacterium]|nr:hypothetical protein [Bdellovibrionales bacterium]
MKLVSEFSWKSVCLLVATSFLVAPMTWAEEGDPGLHCPYEFDRHLNHCGKRHPDGSFTPSFKLSTSNVVHYNENYENLSGYGVGWDEVQFPDPIEWDRFGGARTGEVDGSGNANCRFGMACPNGA